MALKSNNDNNKASQPQQGFEHKERKFITLLENQFDCLPNFNKVDYTSHELRSY